MSVTPAAGNAAVITTGGTAVTAALANPNGGFITNPLLASDQGIAVAEVLYINPTGINATTSANGTTFALQPGQTWFIIPGQTTTTTANATTSGHKYSIVVY